MDSSLKHCLESAEIMDVPKCLASSMANEVLPTAVGPAIIYTVGLVFKIISLFLSAKAIIVTICFTGSFFPFFSKAISRFVQVILLFNVGKLVSQQTFSTVLLRTNSFYSCDRGIGKLRVFFFIYTN